jgi:hypothetical protein
MANLMWDFGPEPFKRASHDDVIRMLAGTWKPEDNSVKYKNPFELYQTPGECEINGCHYFCESTRKCEAKESGHRIPVYFLRVTTTGEEDESLLYYVEKFHKCWSISQQGLSFVQVSRRLLTNRAYGYSYTSGYSCGKEACIKNLVQKTGQIFNPDRIKVGFPREVFKPVVLEVFDECSRTGDYYRIYEGVRNTQFGK